MELYYAAINILDYYVKENKTLSEEYRCYLEDMFYKLCEIGDMKIEDIGDANDCPNAKTFNDLVLGFDELFKTRQRI